MAASSNIVTALSELNTATDSAAQGVALRRLKNETIGHVEKKEVLVKQGLLDVLARLLHTSAKTKGKRKTNEANGDAKVPVAVPAWSADDDVRLQAIILLGSLAQGGPQFATPILAARVVPGLVNSLNLSSNSSRIVIATLRTLVAIFETGIYANPFSETARSTSSVDAIYVRPNVRLLADILASRTHTAVAQSQALLACKLICATCDADCQRSLLLSCGVLDLLAAKLAAHLVSQGAWSARLTASQANNLPSPPSSAALPWYLRAINTILGDSKYRASRLLYSPFIDILFPVAKSESAIDSSSFLSSRSIPKVHTPVERHLPRGLVTQLRSENGLSDAFPALGSQQAPYKYETFASFADSQSHFSAATKSESSLVPWLVHLIRSGKSLCRLEAARLLARLSSAEQVSRTRDRMLAFVVVPILVDMMDEVDEPMSRTTDASSLLESEKTKAEASVVLAMLIRENPALQKAASEAGCIKKICQLLKYSFEPLEHRPPSWSVDILDEQMAVDELSPSRILGLPGLSADIVNRLHCRKGALQLLASLADKEDKYRQDLTEHGVGKFLVDSLVPFSKSAVEGLAMTSTLDDGDGKILPATLGNSVPVLLAACTAAKVLSRSIKILRTSLIDAGIVDPIYKLMKHFNVPVLIEATDVVCNLVMELSPMRQPLLDAGAVILLCEHAHSADSQIRLSSLWALKHLVLQAPREVRHSCFEELGAGWLVQIITGGSSSTPGSTNSSQQKQSMSMGAANAAGERVNILNKADDELMPDSLYTASSQELPRSSPLGFQDSVSDLGDDTLMLLFPLMSLGDILSFATRYRTQIADLRAHEDASAAQANQQDELRIEQQGLDFIRNFIVDSVPGSPLADEMIDYLFNTISSARIFEILTSKLAAGVASIQTINSATLSATANDSHAALTSMMSVSNTSARVDSTSPAAVAILESTIYSLVQIAAGSPRHRSLLISQKALLNTILPLLKHPVATIRVGVIWAIINLTWADDVSDAVGSRQRALELKQMGFEDAVRAARDADESLDFKERAATALEQIGKAGRSRPE